MYIKVMVLHYSYTLLIYNSYILDLIGFQVVKGQEEDGFWPFTQNYKFCLTAFCQRRADYVIGIEM